MSAGYRQTTGEEDGSKAQRRARAQPSMESSAAAAPHYAVLAVRSFALLLVAARRCSSGRRARGTIGQGRTLRGLAMETACTREVHDGLC